MACNHSAQSIRSLLLPACVMLAGSVWSASALGFEVEPKARLHLDYATHNADVQPLANDLILRRLVVGLEGEFTENWSFEVGYNLDDDGHFDLAKDNFRDVTVTWEGWQVGDITVGQFKVPFGMEEMTSSNDVSFVERALPVDAFGLSRRMGAEFARERDDYTVSLMAFGDSLDGDDQGRGLAARATWLAMRQSNGLVHLGISAGTQQPRSKVDFDTTPESRVADEDLVNTGRVQQASRVNRLGVEAAWQTGPYSVQAEWMQVHVQRRAGNPDAELHGGYVAASWVLTGESRPYKHGRFKDIRPTLPSGAWELAARYSYIDLDGADLHGGKEHNITLGVNYYLNKHLRIMLNFVKVESKRRGVTDDPEILALRVQAVL